MPELPEIETVKLQLQQVLPGMKIDTIEVLKERTVVGNWKLAVGKEVLGIKRKGKVLIIDLHDNVSLAFHFKMTGQLVFEENENEKLQIINYKSQNRIVGGHPTKDFVGVLPSKHTRVVITLGEAKLYFNEQRLFGWMKVGTTEDINQMTFIEKLGPEIWEIDNEAFVKRLEKIKRPIKLVIMDQEVLSGVGNIYANDACWVARVDPTKLSVQCPGEQLKRLHEAIKQVLEEGIKCGGATAADAKYIDLHGLGGHYQEHFKTYDRKGEACLRGDGGVIEKISLGGRGTYYCPVCQK